jgi:SAM-dependent methyltransferase
MGEPGSAGQLPTTLGSHESAFDAVCASMVLHVFETKEEVAEFVRRVLRLLKPGGTFFGRNRPQWVW